MIVNAVLFGLAPALGMLYMALAVSYVITYLCPILKAALIGIAAIILIPRLISATPVIIFLIALAALVNGVKRVVG